MGISAVHKLVYDTFQFPVVEVDFLRIIAAIILIIDNFL